MLLEILLLPIETTDMLLKEAPAWSTIISNKSFDVAFLFTLPSLINTVLLVVAGSSLYSSPPAIIVAGEKLGVASAERNGLLSKRNSQSVISLSNNQVALIHTTLSMEWDATNMILYLCSDTPMSILSVVLRSGSTTNRCSINTVYRSEVLATVKFYKEVNSNHIVKLYIKNLSEYTLTIIKENLYNFNGNYKNIQKAAIDVAGMEEVNIIK